MKIYPSDLFLTTEKNTSATFLDLDINILHKIFDISVHDKTNNFNLNVVKYPSLQFVGYKAMYLIIYCII